MLIICSVKEVFSTICVSFGDNVANFCAIFLAIGCCMILAEFFKRKLQVTRGSNDDEAAESKDNTEMQKISYGDIASDGASGTGKQQSSM